MDQKLIIFAMLTYEVYYLVGNNNTKYSGTDRIGDNFVIVHFFNRGPIKWPCWSSDLKMIYALDLTFRNL